MILLSKPKESMLSCGDRSQLDKFQLTDLSILWNQEILNNLWIREMKKDHWEKQYQFVNRHIITAKCEFQCLQ